MNLPHPLGRGPATSALRTPVVLVTGIDPDTMAAAVIGLSWDLAGAVVVRHVIDPEREVLARTVSDVSGILEHEEIQLEHACVSCALREDVVPTIERLARDGRWQSVVACLPVGAESVQVGNAVAGDTRLQRHLKITGVVAALAGDNLVDDLLGDDILADRGAHSGPDDERGVGEVGCALVEYADVVVLTENPDPLAVDLIRALSRPGAEIVVGSEHLDAARLVAGVHDHERTSAWIAPLPSIPLPPLTSDRVWRVELTSDRPFHPGRLLEDAEGLGSGRHRSRGTFWLPTRPGQVQLWDGAGGHLSLGTDKTRGQRLPRTRLLVTGVGPEPAHLRATFDHLLMAPEELIAGPRWPRITEDGFEPWLGDICDIA